MSTPSKRIYLDYAASTPVDAAALAAMLPFFSELFANPGSIHTDGQTANEALQNARVSIAGGINARPQNLFFTSGGTEGNNLAIFGAVESVRKGESYESLHVITSAVEHSSVRDCFKELERRGVAVSYVPTDSEGVLDMKALAEALTERTVLVSIMQVNNEIGVIQPIREVVRAVRTYEKRSGRAVLVHTDASQAACYLPIDVEQLGVDLLTLDGQKLYAPKGVGVLYVKEGVVLEPILRGGNQERGLRPGTENPALAIGMAEGFRVVRERQVAETKRLAALRDAGIKLLLARVPKAQLNGSLADRLPNNINISIPGMTGEELVLLLDAHGISAGTRSACLGRGGSSYVVEELGKDAEAARGTLRLSLGFGTTMEHIERVADVLASELPKILAVRKGA